MEAIGRNREKAVFKRLYEEKKSHFVAVYGRRRIGKTFLIKNYFKTFSFQHTGIANVGMTEQLETFSNSLQNYSSKKIPQPSSWAL